MGPTLCIKDEGQASSTSRSSLVAVSHLNNVSSFDNKAVEADGTEAPRRKLSELPCSKADWEDFPATRRRNGRHSADSVVEAVGAPTVKEEAAAATMAATPWPTLAEKEAILSSLSWPSKG